MRKLNITWLGACSKCDNGTHRVYTEKGYGFRLYEDDKVICGKCGHIGRVKVDDHAYVVWVGE